jgi:hypothetical protein
VIDVQFQLVERQLYSLRTAVMDDSDHLRRWESGSRRSDGASSSFSLTTKRNARHNPETRRHIPEEEKSVLKNT